MKDHPPIAYLVEESHIERAHDSMIAANAALRDHVAVINAALDFIDRLVTAEPHRDDDELVVLRLAIRCFNSAAAGLRVLRCGYFQPAFSLVRDLLETPFLLDFFSHDRAAIARWRTLPAREREKEFKPVKVREKLDKRDGFKDAKREKAYRLLSAQASHPTPEGFTIISPAAMTKIGPFPDNTRLTAGLQELAKRVGNAAVIIDSLVVRRNPDRLQAKSEFYPVLQEWMAKYFKQETPPAA